MTRSLASKCCLTMIAGAALLAGCASGGVLRQAQDDMRQLPSAAGVAKSWMSPDAKKVNLVYISDSATYDVYVYSFPKGTLVGTLTDQNNPAGLCTDRHHHVFVTQLYGHQIVEYKAGETQPIKTLSDPGYEPGACSVNGSTGDLAVANIVSDQFTQGNIVIYSKASGSPTTYSPPGGSSGGWFSVNDVGYDVRGNAYFAGTCAGAFCAGELPMGASNTEDVTLSVSPQSPGTVQLDGQYMTFADQSDGTIYAYTFDGTAGTEMHATTLSGSSDVNGSWILVYDPCGKCKVEHIYVVAPQQNGADALLYSYSGGEPLKTFTGLTQPFGATYAGRRPTTY